MIRVTPTIAIDEREIEESFIRSSGPGGQNVNKLSTAVQLRLGRLRRLRLLLPWRRPRRRARPRRRRLGERWRHGEERCGNDKLEFHECLPE